MLYSAYIYRNTKGEQCLSPWSICKDRRQEQRFMLSMWCNATCNCYIPGLLGMVYAKSKNNEIPDHDSWADAIRA